jgi:hypothetical protein
MRLARIALLISCLLFPACAPSAPIEHLPLFVLENGGLSDDPPDFAIVTIGSLDKESLPGIQSLPQTFTSGDQPRWYTFPETGQDTIAAMNAGNIKLAGPVAGRTVLLLVAPFLNIRQSWIPSALTLQNNTITSLQ